MNFFDFILGTYDAPLPRNLENLKSARIPYLSGTRRDSRCRVMQTDDRLDILPNIVGGWFPRHDRVRSRELYCLTILAVLKPWRTLNDLALDKSSFEAAYEDFLAVNPALHDFIDNVQHYYVCHDAAKRKKTTFTALEEIPLDIRPAVETVSY